MKNPRLIFLMCRSTPTVPACVRRGVRYGNMVLGITAEPMQDAEARKRALNSELLDEESVLVERLFF